MDHYQGIRDGKGVEMKTRPFSQIGAAKLLGITMAILMIAAVACTSGTATSQPAPADTGANTAGSSTGDQSSATGSVATTEPEPSGTAASEATADAQIEQAIGALFLEMTSPDTDELFVTQSSFEFSGRTSVDALLSVNDHILEVDEQGRFAVSMDLEEGPNVIEVVASNALGEQFDQVLLVIYEPA